MTTAERAPGTMWLIEFVQSDTQEVVGALTVGGEENFAWFIAGQQSAMVPPTIEFRVRELVFK